MLHTKTPAELFRSKRRNIGIPTASRGKPSSGKLAVANRGGKSYSSRMVTNQPAESAKLTDDLITSVGTCESMNLVDYYKFQAVKEADEIVLKDMMVIPNIIDPSVPIGKDDSENVEVEQFGEKNVPDFEIPYHTDSAQSEAKVLSAVKDRFPQYKVQIHVDRT